MDDLAAERCRYRERSAIDERAGSSSGERAGVANIAAYRLEQSAAARGSSRNRILAAWCTRRSHEVGEGQHVVAVVLRILHWIERRWERHVDNAFSGAGGVLVRAGISSGRAAPT